MKNKYFSGYQLHAKHKCAVCGSEECDVPLCPSCGSAEFARIEYDPISDERKVYDFYGYPCSVVDKPKYGCTSCGNVYYFPQLDRSTRDPEVCMTMSEYFGY